MKSKRVNKQLRAFILKYFMPLSYDEEMKTQGFPFPPTQKPRFWMSKDGGITVRFVYTMRNDHSTIERSITLKIPPEYVYLAKFSLTASKNCNRIKKFNDVET